MLKSTPTPVVDSQTVTPSNGKTASPRRLREHSTRISRRVNAVPPSGIRRYFDIAATMEDVVSLGIGEPDFVTARADFTGRRRQLAGGPTRLTPQAQA